MSVVNISYAKVKDIFNFAYLSAVLSRNLLKKKRKKKKKRKEPPRDNDSPLYRTFLFQGPPNGSIHLTVPRAPPPPRAKSPPENQPLLQSATVSSRVSQATMSEMRV